jgi:hypothetical protein
MSEIWGKNGALMCSGPCQVYHTETDLPKSLEFLKADLSKDPTADVEAAEK